MHVCRVFIKLAFTALEPHVCLLDRVDGAHDLADGRDVVLDQEQRLVLKRAHSLRDRHTAQLVLRGPADHKPLDFRGNPEKFVDTYTVSVAGASTEVATLA